MGESSRSLALSRSKGNVTSSSSSSSSSANLPSRAKKILVALDRGLQNGTGVARESSLRTEGTSKSGVEDGSRIIQGKKVRDREEVVVEEEDTDEQRLAKKSKQRDDWRRIYSSRPKQTYLVPTSEDPDISTARSQEGEATPSTSTSSSRSQPRSIPQVPLFSTSSKREIISLTSRKALRDEKNPITHSTVGAGTLHYVSSSTGHQQANRVGVSTDSSPQGWWHTRMRKLKAQATSEEKQSDLFRGVNVYINGYAGEKIGNKELQRLLCLNGAQVHYLPNGSTTHIVSEMPLSAKKTQEMLQIKAARVKKFVKVDWILDSLEIGKRRPEYLYAHPIPIQLGISQMLQSRSSGKATTPGVGVGVGLDVGVSSKGGNLEMNTVGTLKTSEGGDSGLGDWREAGRRAAALRDASFTDRQRRCS